MACWRGFLVSNVVLGLSYSNLDMRSAFIIVIFGSFLKDPTFGRTHSWATGCSSRVPFCWHIEFLEFMEYLSSCDIELALKRC